MFPVRRPIHAVAACLGLASATAAPAQGLLDPAPAFGRGLVARHAATDLAAGLAVNGALVWSLQRGGDQVPNLHAFDSGRTAAAFTAAPILSQHFGWKIGVPAYALATMTSLGIQSDSRPSTTEFVAGAALGLLVGHTVAHRRAAQMPENLYMGKRGVGLKLRF